MSGQEEALRVLGEEFPGWLVRVSQDALGACWHAMRPLAPGRGGAIGLHGDSPALLRELLEETDRCDARLALRELAAALAARGVTVRAFDTNLIVTGAQARERLIICRRGEFRWGMGGEAIGPIVQVGHAAARAAEVIGAPA